MTKKVFLCIFALAIFAVVPANAAPKGCKKFSFYGSYTAPDVNRDIFGDGSSVHSLVFQLTINSDGTANQYWTGLPDYLMNAGSGSPQIGSWTCRSDGNLVVTLIQGTYFPIDSTSGNPNILASDIELAQHFRTTYLFSVDDENTITRQQSRTRRYLRTDDPTDPNGGALFPLNNTVVTFRRLAATGADLLAPQQLAKTYSVNEKAADPAAFSFVLLTPGRTPSTVCDLILCHRTARSLYSAQPCPRSRRNLQAGAWQNNRRAPRKSSWSHCRNRVACRE